MRSIWKCVIIRHEVVSRELGSILNMETFTPWVLELRKKGFVRSISGGDDWPLEVPVGRPEVGSTRPTCGDVLLLGLQPVTPEMLTGAGKHGPVMLCSLRAWGPAPISPGFRMMSDVPGHDSVLCSLLRKMAVT